MEVKACMGCFVEWDKERAECPVCGWSPQKPLEEDKNGWHQGKIIAKRFLLGNCYLKKKDFVASKDASSFAKANLMAKI